MVSINLEGLWMFYDGIVDFQFFIKFHIFELSQRMLVMKQKKLLIKPRFIRTSSRLSVLLWKVYGCFLIELPILDFSSNFTGPDLQ